MNSIPPPPFNFLNQNSTVFYITFPQPVVYSHVFGVTEGILQIVS